MAHRFSFYALKTNAGQLSFPEIPVAGMVAILPLCAAAIKCKLITMLKRQQFHTATPQ